MIEKKGSGGFSIIETLVVTAIIVLAVTVSIPWRNTVLKKESTDYTVKKMAVVEEALVGYYVSYGSFPVQLAGLESSGLIEDDFGDDDYLYDYWKETFVYQSGSGNTCNLWSKGPNKTDDNGTGDDITVNPGSTVIDATAALMDIDDFTDFEIEILEMAGDAWETYKTGNWPANIMNLWPWYVWDPSLLYDQWGNLYVSDPDQEIFYSMGPNGIDDGGTGDDIIL